MALASSASRIVPRLIVGALAGLVVLAVMWWWYFGGDDERAVAAMENAGPPPRPLLAITGHFVAHCRVVFGIPLLGGGYRVVQRQSVGRRVDRARSASRRR